MSAFEKISTYEEFYEKMPNGNLENLIKLMDTPGFDVNYQNLNVFGYTPLMDAVLYDRADVAEELVKRGATLTNPTVGIDTYINVAAQKGSLNMINFLLSKGVNFNNHTIKLAKKFKNNEDAVHILETWEAKQVIPAFNEAGRHIGVGRIHNEDLIDMSEYMGVKGRDYGGGIKRNKNSKKRKSYKKKTMKKKSYKNKTIHKL